MVLKFFDVVLNFELVLIIGDCVHVKDSFSGTKSWSQHTLNNLVSSFENLTVSDLDETFPTPIV